MKKIILPVIGFLYLSGCSTYDVDPAVQANIDFQERYSLSSLQGDTIPSPWWRVFDRKDLTHLIEKSFQQNQDITIAVSRVKQAEALAKNTNSFRMPQIGLEAGAQKSIQDGNSQRGSADIVGALDWEVDIFNRIGYQTQADRLETKARIYDVEAVKVSLSAEIAESYFGAVAANKTLSLLRSQLELDKDLLKLLELRMDNGIGTSVEVLQQKSRVADSKSLIPTAQADLRIFENRLDVLLGVSPDAKDRIAQDENLFFQEELPELGIPAELILLRPDLKAAQAELIAADADIGAAIADRLPKLTLSGEYGFNDSASFTGPVGLIASSFVQPLIDWGQRKAVVERNRALYEEQLAAFTKLYLEAIEEVENALYQEQQQRDFINRLDNRRDILQKTVNETESRYKQGVDDYLPVLNALQELRQVERSLITEELNLIRYRIQLYRALGGPVTELSHT